MAFFQLVLKARKLEEARKLYHNEKLQSIEISMGKKIHYTLKQKIRIQRIKFKLWRRRFIEKIITSIPAGSWIYRKFILLAEDGTFENFILKSLIGFLGGVFLTYMFFIFFMFQLHFTLYSATSFCSIFGVILTMGLAYSYRIRCIVFLLLPQFFSKRGRQAMIAYAFILTLTGPARNTLYNVEVLSESLSCGQEQLKEAIRAIIDLIKQPFYALRYTVGKIIQSIKDIVKKIEEALLAIKRIVLSILHVIKSVYNWLTSIINMCNKKLGTPYVRCKNVFDEAVADCLAQLGPINSLCDVASATENLCYVVKPLDFICIMSSVFSDVIVGSVRKKIKKFTNQMKTMFYVKIHFSHSFHFQTNKTHSYKDVAENIITDIKAKTNTFLLIFNWMSFIMSFFFLYMLLKVLNYRRKWLTKDRFDNKYLTSNFLDIDLVRTKQEKETALPLNRRERKKYISLTSITLIGNERVRLMRSMVFLGLTTFKLSTHMFIDYSLYWILSTIRYHGRFQTKSEQVNSVGVYVSGDGYLAELYRSIIRSFSPSDGDSEIDSLPCLPDPMPPDYDLYARIITLIAFCWIMAIFEPYGLRLRQIVMGYYYPERAKQRAVWLYNHIIRSRGNFLKFARRQLRRKFGIIDDEKIEKVTCKERMWATCPILNIFFPQNQKMCLLCGSVERTHDPPHIKCHTPNCAGLFCILCFADLQNLCTICKVPLEYGDLSDFSEEKDSSEDELGKLSPTMEKKMISNRTRITSIEKNSNEKKEFGNTEENFDKLNQPLVTGYTSYLNGIQGGLEWLISPFFRLNEESQYTTEEDVTIQVANVESDEPNKLIQRHLRYKDAGGQTIRDDVTTQIFNEVPEVKEEYINNDSYHKNQTSSFLKKTKKRLKFKFPKKCAGCFRQRSPSSYSNLSSSENEEDNHEKLSGTWRLKKRKRNKDKGSIFNKLPWIKKKMQIKKEEMHLSSSSELLIEEGRDTDLLEKGKYRRKRGGADENQIRDSFLNKLKSQTKCYEINERNSMNLLQLNTISDNSEDISKVDSESL